MAGAARHRHDGGMTQPPISATSPASPPRSGLDAFFDWFRGLGVVRDTDNRWFGGVASGLARRLNVDPILVRAAVILLALFGGFGLTIYLIAWLLLPDPSGRIVGEAALRDGDAGGVALIVVIAILLLSGLALGHNGPWWLLWWLLPVAFIGWLVVRSSDRRRGVGTAPPVTGGPTAPGPYPAPPPGAPFGQPAPGAPAAPPPAGASATYAAAGAPVTGAAPTSAASPAGPPAPPSGPAAASGPWSGAPYGYGGPSTQQWSPRPPMPPRTPLAPPPPRPRRRRAGGFFALIALGLALAGYGIGFLLDGPVGFPGTPELLGLAIALGAVSLLAIGLGITGRRGGLASVLVIVIGLSTWAATLSPVGFPTVGTGIGTRTWTPVASSGQVSYELGLGEGVLDLGSVTRAAAGGGDRPHIDVQVGVGDLRIVVPSWVTAHIAYDTGLGSVHATDAAGNHSVIGPQASSSANGTITVGSGPTAVDVSARVGLGDISIEAS